MQEYILTYYPSKVATIHSNDDNPLALSVISWTVKCYP